MIFETMKKTSVFLIAAVLALTSTTSMAQSEFSSGLIGVGLVTRDLDRSLDFYLNIIGMTKVSEFDVDGEFGTSSGLTDGIAFHVDVLKLQDSPNANQLKLMSFGKEGSHPMPRYIHDDTGIQYITINVRF